MSMRGEIISKEYQQIVWVDDDQGRQFACYVDELKGDGKNKHKLTEDEKRRCLDVSQVLGDSW